MFQYCGNNPVNRADPTGHAFMFLTAAIGAVAGAIVGGIVGYVKTGTIEGTLIGVGVGALAGGLIGLTCGAAAGIMLAGSATATTASVMAGGSALIATVGGGGVVAGAMMIADNISQAVSNAPQVFWSGGTAAKEAAQKVATEICGKTLEMTSLGQYLENIMASYQTWQAASANFANVASNSGAAIYSIQNAAGVAIQCTWASIECPLLRGCDIAYGIVT